VELNDGFAKAETVQVVSTKVEEVTVPAGQTKRAKQKKPLKKGKKTNTKKEENNEKNETNEKGATMDEKQKKIVVNNVCPAKRTREGGDDDQRDAQGGANEDDREGNLKAASAESSPTPTTATATANTTTAPLMMTARREYATLRVVVRTGR
jgi:hypothetical protein